MEIHTEPGPASWTTPQCPFVIEYAPRVLDEIRLAVMDAFFSLPRGGAEIGGVLLGTHSAGRVSIVDYRALECEHAFGPGFTLSDRDKNLLTHLLAGSSSGGIEPVGWYHSHTRTEIFLSEADLDVHNTYFPECWQVALVIKPHTFHPARAGFFFRERDGSIYASTTYQEFQLQPLGIRQIPTDAPPSPPQPSAPAQPPAPPRPMPPVREPLSAPPRPMPPVREPFSAPPPPPPPMSPVREPLSAPPRPMPPLREPLIRRPPRTIMVDPQPIAALRAPLQPPLFERAEPEVEAVAPETITPEVIEPELVEPEPVEPEPVEPEMVEPDALEPEALATEAVEPETGEPEEVEAETLEPEAVELEEIDPEPVESEPVELEAAELEAVDSEVIAPDAAEPEAIEPDTETAEAPADEASQQLSRHPDVPSFLQPEPVRSWKWVKVAATIAVGAGLGSLAYATRDGWVPSVLAGFERLKGTPASAAAAPVLPPAPAAIGLSVIDTDGQLQVHWDRLSTSVRSGSHAVLEILDSGGAPQALPLDEAHLESGIFTYARQGERVDVALAIDQPNGKRVRESTTFLGKLPDKPEDAKVLKRQRDDLARQNTQLQADMRTAVERARKAEKAFADLQAQAKQQQKRRLQNQSSK